eukprot:8665021-Prorocentrum_lima.AAC.1
MTSSLVGSEMCIRDRLIEMPRPRSGDIDPAPSPPIGGAGNRALTNHPVSYTHLTLPTICSV